MSVNNGGSESNSGQHSGGNFATSQLELTRGISYIPPLKKIHSVRSSIMLDSRSRSYGKIQTDFLDRSKTKAEQLRNEMGDVDHELIENVIVGEFNSSDDERMSGISDQNENQMDMKNVPRVT